MRSLPRLLLGIVLGWLLGSLVNMGLVQAGHALVPLPDGLDASNLEALKAAMPSFGPGHFVFPFLSHALGTLVGAFVATKMAPGWGGWPAGVVGGLFLAGGITIALMVPAPAWFIAVDLLLAYVPFAWLGYWLGGGRRVSTRMQHGGG